MFQPLSSYTVRDSQGMFLIEIIWHLYVNSVLAVIRSFV